MDEESVDKPLWGSEEVVDEPRIIRDTPWGRVDFLPAPAPSAFVLLEPVGFR